MIIRRWFVSPPEGGVHRLVLLRHGQSEWNAMKRFTGWVDVDLSEQGRDEAIHAGLMLQRHGFQFDEAHTSLLKRAVRTLWSALHACDQHWIEVKRSWRLNERHYGALQGMSKDEVKRQMGEELLQKFRRGFDQPPIAMREDHPFWTGRDRRYHTLGPDVHPTGESLRMCQQRVLPYWQDAIAPSIRRGSRVLISAHNNVLRCLVQYLDKIPVDRIREIEIPTGVPLVYDLDANLAPVGDLSSENGFTGKFLIDKTKRDAEYLANLEAITERRKTFARRVDPVTALNRDDIQSQCEAHGLQLPKAWANN
ncbi:hypothetical protein CTAYLR_004115 [Chrysophaeum taylorii]|uniref:Phosphoglycerate mutase n=1 Tax=Chrysophaeum taylorii TaxID=2483200 RepID=A0AAD7XKC8_9STRA|nr:hypothetical protein CTAYLR_004115 [Chrysophaeum taylorii]